MAAKLVLSLVNNVSEYQRLLKADAEAAAYRTGFELEIHDGEDSVANQIRQMRECIRREKGKRPSTPS